MGLIQDAVNRGVDAVASPIDQLSVHSADPGSTGANQVAIASCDYGSADGSGVADLSANVVLDMSAGDEVTHYGVWAAGVFQGGAALSASKSFSNDGALTVTSAPVQS